MKTQHQCQIFPIRSAQVWRQIKAQTTLQTSSIVITQACNLLFIVRCVATRPLVNTMAQTLAMAVKASFDAVCARITCIRADSRKIVLLTRTNAISVDFVD